MKFNSIKYLNMTMMKTLVTKHRCYGGLTICYFISKFL